MNGRDLLAEMNSAQARLKKPHFDKLASLGVSMRALGGLSARQHTVGLMTIEVAADGSFTPFPDGFPACVVAVVWPEAHAFGDAGIFDLVAFKTDDPSRWWLRAGTAFALGEHLLGLPDPVSVVRTPVDWLACGGDAVCILDWSDASPIWSALRCGPPLQFNDEALCQQVRNALVRAAPMPSMETIKCAA